MLSRHSENRRAAWRNGKPKHSSTFCANYSKFLALMETATVGLSPLDRLHVAPMVPIAVVLCSQSQAWPL